MAEITEAKFEFHERYWRNISQDAKDFIRKLLTLDPKARPTATEAMKDKWMTGEDAADIDILATVRENFNPRKTLKNAVRAVSAMNRLRSGSLKAENNKQDGEKPPVPALAHILKVAAAAKNSPPKAAAK